MSCIIDLFYLFLGQLWRELVMKFNDVQISTSSQLIPGEELLETQLKKSKHRRYS